ncbi:MAG: hypothetical protein OH338_04980 [Candidatus Parvarchaeota archaeon]|nr:hypothetical protein [Candidatus Parvarchaeum tengchongense]
MNDIWIIIKYADLLRSTSNEKYKTQLYKSSKLTQVTIYKIVSIWQKYGLVETRKGTREIFVKLTKKGEEFLNKLDELIKVLKVEG